MTERINGTADATRARLLLASMLVTTIVTRILLHWSPESDLDVGGYNIHHLFTGLLLITAGGIPSVLFRQRSRALDVATATFGAGLGLALDEWVYLIVTDGSNASYLLPESVTGSVAMVGLAAIYVLVLMRSRPRRRV